MKTADRSPPGAGAPSRRLRLALVPLAVLALSLGMTYGLWQTARTQSARALEAQLGFWTSKVADGIEDRIDGYTQVLRGVVGLFDASETVSRAEFRRYVESLRLAGSYPGFQGIGYAAFVPAGDKARHIAAVRREGFPDYDIRPPGARDFYTAVLFIEPFAGRNLRAFGYDMAPEPIRWAAAERARDLGEATLSGKVRLQQEGGTDIQPGFVLFLPVFRPGAPRATVADRRAGLAGWAYAPLRTHDLMQGVLGAIDAAGQHPALHIAVYDGDRETPEGLLFMRGADSAGQGPGGPGLRATRQLQLGGHRWQLAVAPGAGFATLHHGDQADPIAIAGGLGSLLLALFAGVQTLSQMRIAALLRRADLTNRELALRERDLLWAQRIAQLGSWSYDPSQRRLAWSEGMYWIWGLDPSQGPPSPEAQRRLIHPDDVECYDAALAAAVERSEPFRLELRIRRPDGEERTIASIGTPHWEVPGRVAKLSGTDQDMTERTRLQEALREQAIRDPLTGLLNRRYLDATLPRELARCQRTGEPLAVAMLDLDRFKPLNDTYGHGAGDAVLRAVGQLLQGFVRGSDLACRYGGDELTLVLPGSALGDARPRLEALRQAVARLRVRYRAGALPPISLSIGVAAAQPHERDPHGLLGRADAALYRAKEGGRNRLETAEPALSGAPEIP